MQILEEAKKVPVGETEISVVKANGKHEAYDAEKLKASLLHSGAAVEDANTVLVHIQPELHNGITTKEIYEHAFAILRGLQGPAARRYSLRRAIMDLGPSGFPFEDFVAAILTAKGFTCLTRQTLLGGCVPHEVDVVAYNEKKLVVCEAKFHNELGTKSDLKVALYIKARFDDLKDNVFNYGKPNRKITDSWLITNTKFSFTAIHYGVCKNLTMIGWNYPEKGNLQDLIEEEALHPITCLSTLDQSEKKLLLERGLVLCSTIKADPTLLTDILGKSFDIKPVINEINEL